MTTRCAESFRLFERVERAQREAQQAGCRAWVREIMDMVREEDG